MCSRTPDAAFGAAGGAGGTGLELLKSLGVGKVGDAGKPCIDSKVLHSLASHEHALCSIEDAYRCSRETRSLSIEGGNCRLDWAGYNVGQHFIT